MTIQKKFMQQVSSVKINSIADASREMSKGRDHVIKETPTRKKKHKLASKGTDKECRQAQDRMATYESLSKLRENTLPELQVIGRFIKTLPDRCQTLYSKCFFNLRKC